MAKKITHGKILMAMHKGAHIMVEMVNQPSSSVRKSYRLSSNNHPVKAEYVEDLLADGWIKANEDGLPGLGESQTYSLARGVNKKST